MTAIQLLTALFNAGIAISVGATVLSLGMSFTIGQLVAPLHRVVLVIVMVALNAVVIPAAAWGIAVVSPMDDKYVAGLVLASIGAGSAAALKAAQLAGRVDLPLAVSVVVVLQLLNIVAVPLWAALTGHRSRIINLGLASVLILLFASPMRDRLSTFYHQKSGLAYLHQWGGTEIAQNQQFMRPVLLDKDPLNIRAFQETVPAGEPLLVWVGTPFVLDYTRNEILDMNIAGLGQAWGRISIPRYVLWQRSGYGIATPEDYRYEIRAFRRRSGQLAARALDVVLWLQTIAAQSKILREENGVVLFQTSEDTLAPPG